MSDQPRCPRFSRRYQIVLSVLLAVLSPSSARRADALSPPPPPPVRVYQIGFSPDGRTLYSAGWTNTALKLRVWDVATATEIGSLDTKADAVHSVQISPDGSILAVAGGSWKQAAPESDPYEGGLIELWNVSTREIVVALREQDWTYAQARFSPDGKTLATWDHYDGRVVVLRNPKTGETQRRIKTRRSKVMKAVFSDDGQLLASTGSPTTAGHAANEGIGVWRIDNEHSRDSDAHTSRQADADRGASGGPRGASGGPIVDVREIVFSQDASRIATATMRWDLDEKNAWPESVQWLNPRPSTNAVEVWDIEDGEPTLRWESSMDEGYDSTYVHSLQFLDGARLVSATADARVKIWDVESGALTKTIDAAGDVRGKPRAFMLVAMLAATLLAATAGLAVWEIRSGSRLAGWVLLIFGSGFFSLVLLGTMTIYSFLPTIPGGYFDYFDRQLAVAISPDGRILAVGSNNTTRDRDHLKLYDTTTWELITQATSSSGDIHAIEFSPDGTVIATGTSKETIDLWDLEAGRLRHRPTSLSGARIPAFDR